MPPNQPPTHLAEVYWPGVSEETVVETASRTEAAASALRGQGRAISLRGTILVRTDETVFCLFEGEERDVLEAGRLAGIAFERVLESCWFPT